MYGFNLEQSTKTDIWNWVNIARDDFEYFYGGSGSQELNWKNVRKLEFTLMKREDADPKGEILLKSLMFK